MLLDPPKNSSVFQRIGSRKWGLLAREVVGEETSALSGRGPCNGCGLVLVAGEGDGRIGMMPCCDLCD